MFQDPTIGKQKYIMGVSKNSGFPKMYGLKNNGKPFFKWIIWGENPPFNQTSTFVTQYPKKVLDSSLSSDSQTLPPSIAAICRGIPEPEIPWKKNMKKIYEIPPWKTIQIKTSKSHRKN